jgi:hypothetical protein
LRHFTNVDVINPKDVTKKTYDISVNPKLNLDNKKSVELKFKDEKCDDEIFTASAESDDYYSFYSENEVYATLTLGLIIPFLPYIEASKYEDNIQITLFRISNAIAKNEELGEFFSQKDKKCDEK